MRLASHWSARMIAAMTAGAYLVAAPFCPRMAAPMASNTLEESTPLSAPCGPRLQPCPPRAVEGGHLARLVARRGAVLLADRVGDVCEELGRYRACRHQNVISSRLAIAAICASAYSLVA